MVISVISVLAVLGLWIFFDNNIYQKETEVELSESDAGVLWEKAYDLYKDRNLAEAKEVIQSSQDLLYTVAEGCELMISVFAELEDYSALEECSKTCIDLGKGLDTAYEGLAFSLSGMGLYDQAIEKLKKEALNHKSTRLLISLARLYLMTGHDQEARDCYLEGVERAEVWSMWVSYGLKIKPFYTDPAFVESLITVVSKKKNAHKEVEQKLIEKAKKLGVSKNLSILLERNV